MAISSSFTYDLSEFKKGIEDRKSDTLQTLKDSAYNESPVRTGRMRDSIAIEENSVTVNTEYAEYTEYRTGWFERSIDNARSSIKQTWQ